MNLSTECAGRASAVFTLDLPPDQPTQFALAPGERMFVDKALPGERFRNGRPPWSGKTANIEQLLWDSATFDWSQHFGKAGARLRRWLARQGLRAQGFRNRSAPCGQGRHRDLARLRCLGRASRRPWKEFGRRARLGLRHVRGTSLVISARARSRGDNTGERAHAVAAQAPHRAAPRSRSIASGPPPGATDGSRRWQSVRPCGARRHG